MDLIHIEQQLEEKLPKCRLVDTDGSYLHVWVPFNMTEIEMLPQFHIIISRGESGSLCLRLLTFHGKELLKNELNSTRDADDWMTSLQHLALCSGLPDWSDSSAGKQDVLTEPLSGNLVRRSFNCSYAFQKVDEVDESCQNCLLKYEEVCQVDDTAFEDMPEEDVKNEFCETSCSEKDLTPDGEIKDEPNISDECQETSSNKTVRTKTCSTSPEKSTTGKTELLDRLTKLSGISINMKPCVDKARSVNLDEPPPPQSKPKPKDITQKIPIIKFKSISHIPILYDAGPVQQTQRYRTLRDRRGKKAPNKCEICLRYFKKPEWRHSICLIPHKRVLPSLAADKIQEPVTCPVCSEGGIDKFELTDHFTENHAELESNCCVECLEVVKIKKGDELRKHIMEKHNQNSLPKEQCPHCGKHYVGITYLKKHISMVHEKDSDNQEFCSACGKSFINKGSLDRHITTVHGNIDRVCPICNTTFNAIVKVKKHLAHHLSDIRPYSCSHCGEKMVLPSRVRAKCGKAHGLKIKVMVNEDLLKTQEEWIQKKMENIK